MGRKLIDCCGWGGMINEYLEEGIARTLKHGVVVVELKNGDLMTFVFCPHCMSDVKIR